MISSFSLLKLEKCLIISFNKCSEIFSPILSPHTQGGLPVKSQFNLLILYELLSSLVIDIELFTSKFYTYIVNYTLIDKQAHFNGT